MTKLAPTLLTPAFPPPPPPATQKFDTKQGWMYITMHIPSRLAMQFCVHICLQKCPLDLLDYQRSKKRNVTKQCKIAVFFPRAAITNDHKFGDLKQQKFIISQCWEPEDSGKSFFLFSCSFWLLLALCSSKSSPIISALNLHRALSVSPFVTKFPHLFF